MRCSGVVAGPVIERVDAEPLAERVDGESGAAESEPVRCRSPLPPVTMSNASQRVVESSSGRWSMLTIATVAGRGLATMAGCLPVIFSMSPARIVAGLLDAGLLPSA